MNLWLSETADLNDSTVTLHSVQERLFEFPIVHRKKYCCPSCIYIRKRVGGIWYEI